MSEENRTLTDVEEAAGNPSDVFSEESAAGYVAATQEAVADHAAVAEDAAADLAAATQEMQADAESLMQEISGEDGEEDLNAVPTPHFVTVARQAREQRDTDRAARKAEAEAKAAQEEEEKLFGDVDDDEEEAPATPSAEEGPVIVFDHVTKEYTDGPEDADNAALKDVSFSINRGEFVFIVGPSGSGKSTLIRLLMREISPTAGSIYIAGSNLSTLRNRQVCKYRRSIGIVFQDFRLLEDRTVFENVAFAQKVVGVPSRKITKNVAKMLSMVRLRNKYRSYPNKLSGGEQQRVAVARALVNNPLILLADEPTGNLDPANTVDIMELLEDINARGTTVVVVTHNHEIVDNMQKRVISLREGVIVDDKKGGYDHE